MEQRIDLSGLWQLSNSKGSVLAVVPGDTHSAWLAAGRMPDPYWAENELQIQGFGRENWVYERTFEVPAALLEHESVILNFDRIDTVATVFINGRKVGNTQSAFVRYRFEVHEFLTIGENRLRIEIESPETAAAKEALKLPYPAPHGQAIVQSPHRNLLRKPQCHGGWDWGICMMVSGITGEVYLQATTLARIESLRCIQQHHAHAVDVTVACEVFSPCGGQTEWSAQLDTEHTTTAVQLQPGLNLVRQTLRIHNPKLWWPNGYGPQPLYQLTVNIAGARAQRRLGLRTLSIRHGEDANGYAMAVEVNHVPIFCKGASWIPADAFPQRQTRAVISDLLASAAAAHMNMIRVWGGGQYESDDFYNLCDEKGLLVWQDFMFACSTYPATPEFLGLVRAEAQYQVKRLQSHPSLALWCGNNENVGALTWFPETRANRDRYLVDYDRLNEGVLGAVVHEFDPERLFWPSSPCGGPGDYSDCWHDDQRGDMHYWSIWFEAKPFEAVHDIKPRFCSEFGYQSFPSLQTIRTYAPEDQWNISAPAMEHHQRSANGNSNIIQCFTRYFRMPEGFENFVYLSQVQQAIANKVAVEHFRRLRPLCMGAIYWQLNDLWPVCSWSSLEYGGKWKLLHYAARRFFAPLLVSTLQTKEGNLEVWINQDGGKASPGLLRLRVIRFSGEILNTKEIPVTLPVNGAARADLYPVSALTEDPTGTFLAVELETGDVTVRNEHLFCEYKKCNLAPAKIHAEMQQNGDSFTVRVESDRPAFWVSLNVEGIRGEFDDNGFLLLPGEPRVLRFTPKEPTTLAQFQKKLIIRHLRDTYC